MTIKTVTLEETCNFYKDACVIAFYGGEEFNGAVNIPDFEHVERKRKVEEVKKVAPQHMEYMEEGPVIAGNSNANESGASPERKKTRSRVFLRDPREDPVAGGK